MSWRIVVISNSAKLDFQLGYMVIRKEDTIRIYLGEIHTVIIETTAVSITSSLITEWIKHKIKVIFCDDKRNPSSELVPYYGSHDSTNKIRKQIKWGEDIKGAVWTAIVKEKINQQRLFLIDLRKPEAGILTNYIQEVEFKDLTNREGHAAKVYFNSLFGLSFKRGSDSSINAALNYGYSIILSAFNREICVNGYITQLGLFHDNMFNPFNLASDLMEPYRVIVDRFIYDMNLTHFDTEQKINILDILNRKVKINNREEVISNAIKIYCKSVFDAIENKNIAEIRFYEYEL